MYGGRLLLRVGYKMDSRPLGDGPAEISNPSIPNFERAVLQTLKELSCKL